MNKLAVITGGANGIGAETAHQFLQRGLSVIVLDIDDANGEIMAAHPNTEFIHCDVSEEEDVLRVFKHIANTYGGIDVAVNCAGILGRKIAIEDYEATNWKHVIDVNLYGTFLCMKQEIKSLRKGGVIINVSSVSGIEVSPDLPPISAYFASKFGINGLTMAVAYEYRTQFRILSICPSGVATNMQKELYGEICGKPPERTALAIVRLALDTNVSGKILTVDEAETI